MKLITKLLFTLLLLNKNNLLSADTLSPDNKFFFDSILELKASSSNRPIIGFYLNDGSCCRLASWIPQKNSLCSMIFIKRNVFENNIITTASMLNILSLHRIFIMNSLMDNPKQIHYFFIYKNDIKLKSYYRKLHKFKNVSHNFKNVSHNFKDLSHIICCLAILFLIYYLRNEPIGSTGVCASDAEQLCKVIFM